ncbi:DofB protein [Hyalangium versicolor]|uniref:DofB protein n=1 Tax=Hyalangium versicolor TaxID=2861190 RepID=UPI002814FFDB|nr:DofB protein [Hyalangium versicolor]
MLNTAFKVDIIDRVIFSRWLRPPSKQDIEAMEAHMAMAHKRLGQSLLYVGSLDSKVKVPNAEERNNLNALMNAARNYCEVAHLIIEGSDLQNSLQRVIISGMLIITRTYDNFLSVHKSVETTADDLSKRLNKDAGPVIRAARDRGLVV